MTDDDDLPPPVDLPELATQVDRLLRLRKLGQAEQRAAQAVAGFPDDAAAHILLGRVLLASDRVDGALTSFEDAAQLSRTSIDTGYWRAAALTRLCRWADADRQTYFLVRSHADSARAHYARGRFYYEAQGYFDALACFDDALALDPRYPPALRYRIAALRGCYRLEDALKTAVEAVDSFPQCAKIRVELAMAHFGYGNDHDAFSECEEAIRMDPGCCTPWLAKIGLLLGSRRLAEADRTGNYVLERWPRNPDVYLYAALIKDAQERYSEAQTFCSTALAINPRNVRALRLQADLQTSLRPLMATPLGLFTAYGTHPEPEWEASGPQAHESADPDPSAEPDADEIDTAGLTGQAEQRELEGKYETALALYDQVLRAQPGHLPALLGRVRALRLLHRFKNAIAAALSAIETLPEEASIRTALGCLHYDRLEFPEALGCFEAALQIDDRNIDAFIGRSAALCALGRYREAHREMRRFTERHGQSCTAEESFRLDDERAWILYDEHRLREAEQQFTKLQRSAEKGPQRAAALRGLGWIYFAEGNYSEADSNFRLAGNEFESKKNQPGDPAGPEEELVPEVLDYNLARAQALIRTGIADKLQEAEDLAYEAAELRGDPAAYVCLGIIHFKMNNLVQAESDFKTALDIDDCHGSHTDLGALYAQMEKLGDAEDELKAAIARDPNDVAAHIELGALFLNPAFNRVSDAISEFKQARSIEPSSVSATVGLAQCLSQTGQAGRAEDELRRAIKNSQGADRWRLHLTLARILIQKTEKQSGDLYAEAYAAARQAIRLEPGLDAEPHYVAGAICRAIWSQEAVAGGRRAHYYRWALNHFRNCLDVQEEHAEALRGLHQLQDQGRVGLPDRLAQGTLAAVALLLLGGAAAAFLLTDRLTTSDFLATIFGALGLLVISALLPLGLVRLKAFKVIEAEFNVGQPTIAPGPAGELGFGPGRLDFALGPAGPRPTRKLA
jgi:tetratricopeptide (TPR) repeat protein